MTKDNLDNLLHLLMKNINDVISYRTKLSLIMILDIILRDQETARKTLIQDINDGNKNLEIDANMKESIPLFFSENNDYMDQLDTLKYQLDGMETKDCEEIKFYLIGLESYFNGLVDE